MVQYCSSQFNSCNMYCHLTLFIQSPSTTPAYASPVYPGEPIATKVLVIVTADCEVYTPLDITGARSAAIIREKIFSKV